MLSIGQQLQERYQITAKLGEGGMGAVYRAYDNRLNKECVVKEMLHSSELMTNPVAAAEQFKREASVLAALRHPGLPVVIDYFTDAGSNYLVMDCVEGQNLLRMIGNRGLSEAAVLNYANQLLDVLEYIHAQGVVHRDIKPANIIIKPDGRAMLVDFGLVKVITPNAAGTNTFLRGVGTPEYAPPEQLKGGTDQRSDIYSLGATLYHALTGRPPLDATDRSMMEMPRIRALNPLVSARTERVLMQALMMQPAKRWQNAATMLAELGSAPKVTKPMQPSVIPKTVVIPRGAGEPPVAPGTPDVLPRQQRRKRMLMGGVVGAIVLILVGVLVLRGAPEDGASATVVSTSTHITQSATVVTTPTHVPTSTFTPTKTAESPTPTSEPATSWRENGNELIITLPGEVEMVLVRVQAGEFLMGSADNNKDAHEDEMPQHRVIMDEYWIGKYEVTNAQFRAFVNETGFRTKAESEGGAWASIGQTYTYTVGANWKYPQGPSSNINGKDNHPVVSVSWDDAVAFCEWATRSSKRAVRLPTEAEWEKAARGASPFSVTDERIYPWGSELLNASLLNYADINFDIFYADKTQDDGYELTAPVGSYPKGVSPFGALDMAGNVAEWTSSLKRGFPYDVNDGREAQNNRDERVTRGGGACQEYCV